MSVLYTVNFKRKRMINRFDAKGRLIETKEELIEETMHDLPFPTARHYVEITGGVMTMQPDPGYERRAKPRTTVKFDYQRSEKRSSGYTEPRRVKTEATKTPEVKVRVKSRKPADYSDLVNTLMENGG